ncbi:MAG: type ISP restriction/modification enzyme, partial [Actinomycetes bacterium]
ITPNAEGDWINQRNEAFEAFTAIGAKVGKGEKKHVTIFKTYSQGINTSRDAWVYSFSHSDLTANVQRMIDFYNSQLDAFNDYCAANGVADRKFEVDSFIDLDPAKISWDRGIRDDLARNRHYNYRAAAVRLSAYRPFTRELAYFDRDLNAMIYQLDRVFPTQAHANVGFYLNVGGTNAPFCSLLIDSLPNLNYFGQGGQFFPRWTYEKSTEQGNLYAADDASGYHCVDNITDAILADYRTTYGAAVSKDDVFYYVYGILHSPAYCIEFASDLKKMLPRIPKVSDFVGFAAAGHGLADLHLGYETAEPYPLCEQLAAPAGMSDAAIYRVAKMSFGKGAGTTKDRSRIVYNSHLTLTGIPDDAYRYMLGSRSAIEWIIDRYQVKTDKPSGIVNDPNDWSTDIGNPRYIVDLLKRIVTVSIETMRIVDALPGLDVIG